MEMDRPGSEQWVSLMNAVVIFGVTLILSYLGRSVIRWISYIVKVNRLPGPNMLKIIYSVLTQNTDCFDFMVKSVRKNGPIHRVWYGLHAVVFVSKLEYIEAILSLKTFNEKSFGYKFLEPWLGQGLLTVTGNRWHTRRRLLVPTFHLKLLEGFNEVFNAKTQILLGKLDVHCGSGKSFDVQAYITLAALDIVCETAMGIDIKAQDNQPSDYVESIYQIVKLFGRRNRRPWLFWDFIYYLTKEGKELKRRSKILHSFTTNVITERRKKKADEKSIPKEEKVRLAFLDMLLDMEEDGKGLSQEAIREEVDTFMFGGHDTTSSSMCWVLYTLGLHQDVQDQVFEELKNIFQGEDRFVTTSDVAKMFYIERVIKETMRLYPTVPMVGRNIREEIKIGKYTIPADVSYMMQLHELHKDPNVFPNPEIFNPDNFLPERVRERHPYVFIPFSAGPRNCIGQKFAMLEEKVILSIILRKYKVITVNKVEHSDLTCDMILKPVNGINIKLEPRA